MESGLACVMRCLGTYSDKFCCTRWRDTRQVSTEEGTFPAVSGKRRRSFINRDDGYSGLQEQRGCSERQCENKDNDGRVSEQSLQS